MPHHLELAEIRVSATGYASIGDFEEEVDAAFRAVGPTAPSLLIDLSEATFIELPTLQYIIALSLSRERMGLATRLRLPRGESGRDARDFLRRWKFQEAFRTVTKIPFSQFVDRKDLIYFKGRELRRKYVESHEAKSEKGQTKSEKGETKSESHSGLYVTSRIVFEAMTNAVRHPDASFIQTCSLLRSGPSLLEDGTRSAPATPHFFPFTTWEMKEIVEKGRVSDEAADSWSVEPVLAVLDKHLRRVDEVAEPLPAITQNRHFTVVFWDDGQSMVETLKAALRHELPIRVGDYSEFETSYSAQLLGSNGSKSSEMLSSQRLPSINTPDHLLLASTIYPGVTCDVSGAGHRVHRETLEKAPAMALYGMGLFGLVRAAIDDFGGNVSFRTGRYFMHVKRAKKTEKGARYRIKVQTKPETTPSFLGNMITVRLPLRA